MSQDNQSGDIKLNGNSFDVEGLGFKCRHKIIILDFIFAEDDGICNTLEGDIPYSRGDAIVTGTEGETWPIQREHFEKIYNQDGRKCIRKETLAWAIQMKEPFEVKTSKGILSGKVNDFLIQHEPGVYSIVQEHIFHETYTVD